MIKNTHKRYGFWLALVLISCNSIPETKTLDALVEIGQYHPGKEFCVGNSAIEDIEDLLLEANYDCMAVNLVNGEVKEDSTLVLVRSKLSTVDYLYYDFANRTRTLESWDNDRDKREKIGERLYKRTLWVD